MTLIVMDLESYSVFHPLFLNFGLILLNLSYILVNEIRMQQFWMRISTLQYRQMIRLTEIVGQNKNQALVSVKKTEIWPNLSILANFWEKFEGMLKNLGQILIQTIEYEGVGIFESFKDFRNRFTPVLLKTKSD